MGFLRLFFQRRFCSLKKLKKSVKKFDCVEMKNKIQEEIYLKIKGMSIREENEYRRNRIESGALSELC
jgi:adenylate cyclase class IV